MAASGWYVCGQDAAVEAARDYVELPLRHVALFKHIRIKGIGSILLYCPPRNENCVLDTSNSPGEMDTIKESQEAVQFIRGGVAFHISVYSLTEFFHWVQIHQTMVY